tara:strand:- start:50 stop:484 length:435 start_codon:yes stop_codon:yes gene_type:complete
MLNKILLSIVLLIPSLAYAEDGRFTYLEPGMKAPFKGTLFNDPATAYLLTLPEYYDMQCDLELDYQLGLKQEKHAFEIKDLESQVEFLQKENDSITLQSDERIALLEEQLRKTNKNDRPWYLAAGVVVGIGLTIGIIKGVEAVE